MDSFEIPGLDEGAALRFAPGRHGGLTMTVRSGTGGPDASTSVSFAWLLPLAAWFAGEAVPDTYGEAPGPLLCVVGDGAAVVWTADTWARLHCLAPDGHVEIRVCPVGQPYGPELRLSPVARRDLAARLRRINADGWATALRAA